jgi:5S rRNA maturation endonuclease (ribonuclease M5)
MDGAPVAPVRFTPRQPEPKPVIAWATLLASWKLETTPDMICAHADQLGVDPTALHLLGAVWASEHRAWAFPMRDGPGKVVGVRLRNPHGDKWAIKGSSAGLFLPVMEPQPRLVICEGPTDTAAALTVGLFAIGRPSCLGCEDAILATIQRLKVREVVIVADEDEPGQRGAAKLQNVLRVASVIYTPPAKDIREAIANGLTGDAFNACLRDLRWHYPTKPQTEGQNSGNTNSVRKRGIGENNHNTVSNPYPTEPQHGTMQERTP